MGRGVLVVERVYINPTAGGMVISLQMQSWSMFSPTQGGTRILSPWDIVRLDIVLHGFLSLWGVVPLGFCPPGLLSHLDFVPLGFCPHGMLSSWVFVFLGFCPLGYCPMGFCPVGFCPRTGKTHTRPVNHWTLKISGKKSGPLVGPDPGVVI